jgi:hypothetical protein
LNFKKIKGKANESKKGAQQTDIVSTQKISSIKAGNKGNYLRALPIDRQTILFLE